MPIVYQKDAGLGQGITALGQALGQGISQYGQSQYQTALQRAMEERQKLSQQEQLKSKFLYDLALAKAKEDYKYKSAGDYYNKEVIGIPTEQPLLTRDPSQQQSPIKQVSSAMANPLTEDVVIKDKETPKSFTQEQITKLALSPSSQHNKLADISLKQQEQDQRKFEANRKYFGQGFQDVEDYFNKIQRSNPKKDLALQSAAQSIQSGDVGMFSPNYLADLLGLPGLRTASGVQLVSAGKENLLSNMERTSAKAQNIWFEQKLNSIFPMIGQTEEANKMALTFLEGELELDKNAVEEFNRLKEQDMKEQGYINYKTIQNRVFENLKDKEDSILRKTMYKAKVLEESEKDIEELIKNKNKKVVSGTPLTQQMLKVMMADFQQSDGSYNEESLRKGVEKAKKLGYNVPKAPEFKSWQ